MSKRMVTTTESPPIIFARQGASREELEIMAELFGGKTMVAYGVALVPLGICFYCCLPSYISAFKRNLSAHGSSPLLPLMTHSFRTLKTNYPLLVIFLIAAILFSFFPGTLLIGAFLTNMTSILALAINWYTAMYQLAISILSIHRFINNRQPVEFRNPWTRRQIIVLMVLVFCLVIVRDLGLAGFVFVYAMKGNFVMIGALINYYFLMYITHQSLLFVGMTLQFAMSSQPATSHSENMISIQTKSIGFTKLILFILTAISFITGIQTMVVGTIFNLSDLFLVPLMIEIAEIRATPNVVQPCEIKKEPLKI